MSSGNLFRIAKCKCSYSVYLYLIQRSSHLSHPLALTVKIFLNFPFIQLGERNYQILQLDEKNYNINTYIV